MINIRDEIQSLNHPNKFDAFDDHEKGAIVDFCREMLRKFTQPIPIETAPKDGTVIDVFIKGYGRIANVLWNEKEDGWYQYETELFYYNATHWLPIPQVKGE